MVLLTVFLLLEASLGLAIPVRQAEQAFPVEVLPVEAFPVKTQGGSHLMLALVVGEYLKKEISTSNCSESD